MSTGDDFRLCLIGAGLAAAGIADELRETAVSVTVLEKSRGVGGRAATRRNDGCRYDHGANYIKDSDDRTVELLKSLGEDGLVDIEKPVWPFEADGTISESDRPEAHKWTWEAGITQLAKRLFGRTDAEISYQTRVDSLTRAADAWHLTDTDGDKHGPFDAVVLTPPAPQTADLLRATEFTDEIDGEDVDGSETDGGEIDGENIDGREGDGGEPDGEESDNIEAQFGAAAEAVDSVPYRTIRTVVLHYPFEFEKPYYALVNSDYEHDIGWLSRESCKPGHVPDGESLLVAQMAPDWSTATYDDPLEEISGEVAEMVAQLLGDDRLRDPDWVDDQGWRYALPDAAVDTDKTDPLAAHGLYVAGDWVVGEGRAHEALWNGVAVGERIAARL